MAEATTYLVLLWGDEAAWADATPEEYTAAMAAHGRFVEACAAGGHAVLGGEELQVARTATLVRPGADGPQVVDGPYAETVEQLGGYYLVRTSDLAGLQQAVQIILEDTGTIEIRPIVDHSQDG